MPDASNSGLPRMLLWLVATLLLILLAFYLQATAPGSLLAVTVYKAHLMALGGWGGYWLDRALFPYDRPHEYLLDETDFVDSTPAPNGDVHGMYLGHASSQFGHAMLRRAIIVAACLICVGLGA